MKTKRSFEALTSSKPNTGDRYELTIATTEEEAQLNREAAEKEAQLKKKAAEEAAQEEQVRKVE